MTFGDILSFIWSLMSVEVYQVMDVSISFGDIFVFVIIGTLAVWLITTLFGGGSE